MLDTHFMMGIASEIHNVMTGQFLEIGLLSWFPDDTFCVHLLIGYFECYFYVLTSIVSLL